MSNKLIEVLDEGKKIETISMLECVERFGTLPSGAQQRIRGTKTKPDREASKNKRQAKRAARKRNRQQ